MVTLEADDRATPTLRNVGRSFLMLGANIAYVTRELGIQSPVIDAVTKGLMMVGHVVRIVQSVKSLLAATTSILTMAEVTNTAATAANVGSKLALATVTGVVAGSTGTLIGVETAYTVSTGVAIAATWSWTGALMALRLALIGLGPAGWAMLALGIAGAGVAGYALGRGAGGAAPPAPAPIVGGGPYQPTIQITMGTVSMNTKRDIEETVTDLGTQFFAQMRRFRH